MTKLEWARQAHDTLDAAQRSLLEIAEQWPLIGDDKKPDRFITDAHDNLGFVKVLTMTIIKECEAQIETQDMIDKAEADKREGRA